MTRRRRSSRRSKRRSGSGRRSTAAIRRRAAGRARGRRCSHLRRLDRRCRPRQRSPAPLSSIAQRQARSKKRRTGRGEGKRGRGDLIRTDEIVPHGHWSPQLSEHRSDRGHAAPELRRPATAGGVRKPDGAKLGAVLAPEDCAAPLDFDKAEERRLRLTVQSVLAARDGKGLAERRPVETASLVLQCLDAVRDRL